jgi:outer membrane protein TolC
LDAKSNLRNDQLSFAFALGADKPFYPNVVDCNDDYISDLKLETRDSNDGNIPDFVIEEAQQASPYWRQKKADVIAAENQLLAEYRKAIPLAETSASYGPKDAPEGWGSAFSLEFPIPLFDRNQAGISRAKAELTAAQTEEEKTRRDTIAAVSQAWERYHSLSIKWNKYTKPIAEMAEKNEKSASRLFEEGQINYEEFLIAQRDNKQAQVESLDVWINTSLASWTLSSELGLYDQ